MILSAKFKEKMQIFIKSSPATAVDASNSGRKTALNIIKRPDKMVRIRLAAVAAEFALGCGFKDFLFFHLCFARVFMIVL